MFKYSGIKRIVFYNRFYLKIWRERKKSVVKWTFDVIWYADVRHLWCHKFTAMSYRIWFSSRLSCAIDKYDNHNFFYWHHYAFPLLILRGTLFTFRFFNAKLLRHSFNEHWYSSEHHRHIFHNSKAWWKSLSIAYLIKYDLLSNYKIAFNFSLHKCSEQKSILKLTKRDKEIVLRIVSI